tara:strand:- start:161 stop:541 length:381 start_codon:yes stop_codon:yes gene_type:complete
MTNEIKSHVLSIVADIEQGRQCESCTECGADLHEGNNTCPECEHENCETLSGFDYVADVLDVNWLLDSKREFKGARLLVTFGGPNIWIDTAKKTVEGHWWGDSYTASYSRDEMDIEGACAEWFGCA